jgi:hypothetical protein
LAHKRFWLFVSCTCLALAAVLMFLLNSGPRRDVVDIYPGESIQAALEEAAQRPVKPILRVHAGTYRPAAPNEALIYFNARHDGIVLEGVGEVILTAANPEVADPEAESYPAIVNHVVYFGDGISPRTVLRRVKITGANKFVQAPPEFVPVKTPADLDRADKFLASASSIESSGAVMKTHYFYADGGAILVYGRSYPTVENVVICGNTASPCGGGVSISHHLVAFGGSAVFRDCVFRDNHAATSGSAVDVLSPGSSAILENCLFTGNVSSEKIAWPNAPRYGALTVMPNTKATVKNCTFADNSAGADDRGESTYEKTIFWRNERAAGATAQPAFELNIARADGVVGCFFSGRHGDPQSNLSGTHNQFNAADPQFDPDYRPRNPAYQGIGYRP